MFGCIDDLVIKKVLHGNALVNFYIRFGTTVGKVGKGQGKHGRAQSSHRHGVRSQTFFAVDRQTFGCEWAIFF